jgi:NAD-dependent dihydropyrimidine dehydrogenase PreA subunit
MGIDMKYLKNVSTLEFFPEKCTKCKMCIEVCPHAVFSFENKKISITDKDKCMECGACMKNCDFDAIQVNIGVGCAAAIINGMINGTEPNCDCSGDSGSCC